MTENRSILLDSDAFVDELAKTHDILSAYGDVGWFRPGSGFYDEEMLAAAKSFNYRTVLGTVYPYDAQLNSPQFASRYILDNTKAGSILVLHEGEKEREVIVETLRRVLPELQSRGFRFVLLDELVGWGSHN